MTNTPIAGAPPSPADDEPTARPPTALERAAGTSAVIRAGSAPGRTGNRIFSGLSFGAGVLMMVVLALVAAFLIQEAMPALSASDQDLAEISFMRGRSLAGYVAPLVFGTLLSSLMAVAVAVPLSIGVALFISHFAPRRLAQGLGYLVDLLAAIPSVVYGLWGFLWLAPLLDPFYSWLTEVLGFIPLFGGYQAPAKNIMTASLVLAVMILPIITATIREVFLQTPTLYEEASLALGATRYEMIRQAVLPYARSGIVSGTMLGLGRALGETMAVLMILSPGASINFHLLQAGQHQTIAANIAGQFREAFGLSVSVLIATGLALFIITVLVNSLARWVVARHAEFSGTN